MPIETQIHTIRHAHTRFNAERRYAGGLDVELSDAGIQQAREAAVALSGYSFDVVITSALRRSIQTAQLLVGSDRPLVQTRLCNERRFGVLEGLTWDDVQAMEPAILLIKVGNDLHTVNPAGAEPFEDVWERAKRFRRFIFRQYRGQRMLVVSHGVFLQMFHGLLRSSSCIESLATYPGNLELTSFRFCDDRLAGEAVAKLTGGPVARW